jgi:hypothetical protein
MGVAQVERAEVVAFGLMRDSDELTPEEPEFDGVEEANLPGIDKMPELQVAIEKAMGDYAQIKNGVLSIVKPSVEKNGATSSARLLGLPTLESGATSKTPSLISPREARRIMVQNPIVKNHRGEPIMFDEGIQNHWSQKTRGYRLSSLRQAQDAVREPQDVWTRPGDDGGMRDYYTKTTANPDGTINHTLVVTNHGTGRVVTWISNTREAYHESQRTGLLAHQRGG